MTPGAAHRAGERKGHAARVSGALGVSVVLHVLGAVALGGGAPVPERSRSGPPLEVELVWREAPAPARAPGSAARPAQVGRSRERRDPPRPTEAAAASGPERLEPVQDARGEAPPGPVDGGLPEAVAVAERGGPGEGPSGSGPVGSESPPGTGLSEGGPGDGGPAGGAGADLALLAYREQLSRRVTRHRRYPAQAVRLGLEGTALVWVRINRDGSLAAPPRLEGSSRIRVLDAEALRMVEAAAPFAPLPPALPRESAEFVIPVSFSLRAAG